MGASSNTLSLHHSRRVASSTPSDSYVDHLPAQGTRVTVGNLFGNLPVRVKQRSRALVDRAEWERQWSSVKKDLFALLLAWR